MVQGGLPHYYNGMAAGSPYVHIPDVVEEEGGVVLDFFVNVCSPVLRCDVGEVGRYIKFQE